MSDIETSTVNHPTHYNMSESGIETIKIVRHFDFDCGNAFKYLMRFRYKNNLREDLEKAIWYLNDKIASTNNVSDPVIKVNTYITFKKEVRDYISSVINAEKNTYVRNALILIAEYATFSVPIFVNPVTVVSELKEHIDEIISEEDENIVKLVNDTNELLEKVDKSTDVEDLKQTWEKAKQSGLLTDSASIVPKSRLNDVEKAVLSSK